jgi:DNA-binding transcriptional MerR regulator/effector-binding domain-containing protein
VFTIGDFSKITGLTIKSLRFYHEKGLLAPSHIDEQTGYRYYDRSKIERARVISRLRGLDLSLDEIGRILQTAGDDADLREVMERHQAALESKIRRDRQVLRSLRQFLIQDEEARRIVKQASFEIEEKVTDPIVVASIRMKGRYKDCGPAYGRIGRRFGRHICGKPFMLLYDAEFREEDADYETCMPVRGGKPGDGISIRELPGGRCVTLMHRGPYDQLGRSYATILGFIRDKGHEVVMPTREIYHKGPGMIFRGNPKNYLTEIQILIGSDPNAPGIPSG